MFHEDVVQVIRKRLEQEDDLPDERRPTALARSYYLKVLCDWKRMGGDDPHLPLKCCTSRFSTCVVKTAKSFHFDSHVCVLFCLAP